MQKKSKRLGQVFLEDLKIAEEIVNSANISKNDTVVEIGPGKGVLTDFLLKKTDKLIAIEKDHTLCPYLKNKFKNCNNFHLINGNALSFSYDRLGENVKLVSNLPYNISTPLILLLASFNNLELMTVMLQKEVALRVCAKNKSKNFGRLSIAAQTFFKAEYLFDVPKELFKPVPKVESAVINLKRLNKPRVPKEDANDFFMIVQESFSMRRKTLKNNLKKLFEKDSLLKMFNECDIDPGVRAEMLEIEDFYRITKSYKLLKQEETNI